jgi:hypothetical protein
MESSLNSEKILSLYHSIDRDEQMLKLNDHAGIQIIRKYKNTSPVFADKRMFINFFIEQGYVFGSIDMVIKKDDRWVVVYPDKDDNLRGKISNYSLFKDEDIHFDGEKMEVIFQKRKYNVNGFIDLMEKNHLSNMFGLSKFFNQVIEIFLWIMYFLVDERYEKFSLLKELRSTHEESELSTPVLEADPFFRYFKIYKNLFAFFLGFTLPFLFHFSKTLDPDVFSLQNPFLIFLAVGCLLLLEGVGNIIRRQINLKNSLIKKLANYTYSLKGKLRHK